MGLVDKRLRQEAARSTDIARGELENYAQDQPKLRERLAGALRRAKQISGRGGQGPDIGRDTYAVQALVARGGLTQAEADEYMAKLYPAQQWSGGIYGSILEQMAESDRAESERKGILRGGRGLIASAGLANERPGLRRNRGFGSVLAGDQPVRAERLPEAYDGPVIQRAMDGLANQAAEALKAIRTRPPELPVHSLDGSALRPGSVPFDALARVEVEQRLGSWPTPAEALEVHFAHSTTMDRFVVNNSIQAEGPGRIWTASVPAGGKDTRIGSGPSRYRVVRPGTKFSVMSMRLPPGTDLAANPTPGFLIQYGTVLARIPHWRGTPPTRLLAIEAIGDAPTSLRTLFATGGSQSSLWSSGGTNRDFFWNRTTSEHITLGAYPFAEPFGTDATLAPAIGSLRDCQGLAFQLITGRNGGEVFRQLTSRTCLGRGLRMDAHGPARTIPDGLSIEAASVATAVDWITPTEYRHRVEGFDLVTARLVQGLPFSYDDCERLAASDTHFSLVVMPVFEKTISQNPPPTYASADRWHENGMEATRTTSERLRDWALDIIID